MARYIRSMQVVAEHVGHVPSADEDKKVSPRADRYVVTRDGKRVS